MQQQLQPTLQAQQMQPQRLQFVQPQMLQQPQFVAVQQQQQQQQQLQHSSQPSTLPHGMIPVMQQPAPQNMIAVPQQPQVLYQHVHQQQQQQQPPQSVVQQQLLQQQFPVPVTQHLSMPGPQGGGLGQNATQHCFQHFQTTTAQPYTGTLLTAPQVPTAPHQLTSPTSQANSPGTRQQQQQLPPSPQQQGSLGGVTTVPQQMMLVGAGAPGVAAGATVSSASGSLTSYPLTTNLSLPNPGTPQPVGLGGLSATMVMFPPPSNSPGAPSPGSSLTGYPVNLNLNQTPMSAVSTQSGTPFTHSPSISRGASLTGYPVVGGINGLAAHPRPPPPNYSGGGGGLGNTTTTNNNNSGQPTPDFLMSRSAASLGSPGSSMAGRLPVDNSTWGYAVVDPLHPRLQRVPIAPSAITKTQGVVLYERDVVASSAKPCLSAVCLKYNMPEGCAAGAQCPNFHVDQSYLEKARKMWDPICCAHHNCYFSQAMEKAGKINHVLNHRFVLIFDRAEVELSASQIAFTVGLEQLPLRAGNTRVITGKSLCRLHFDSKCKWTKDCSHIHVCRELFKFLQAFHYPSLSFLLMTETDEDKIVAKVESQPMVVEFLKSSCSEPLIKQLQENGKQAALSALRRCRSSTPDDTPTPTEGGGAADSHHSIVEPEKPEKRATMELEEKKSTMSLEEEEGTGAEDNEYK